MKPKKRIVQFASRHEFRAWLAKNHSSAPELWVGFYKKSSGRAGASYVEAVEEALCYGWIDGILNRVDEERFAHRFTRRRAKSTWSNVNVRRVMSLSKAGKMAEPGLRVFAAREEKRTGIYAFEQERPGLSAKHKKLFRENQRAWTFFRSQPPGYQRLAGFWVSSAKREETQLRHLAKLVEVSLGCRRLDGLNPKVDRSAKKKK